MDAEPPTAAGLRRFMQPGQEVTELGTEEEVHKR